MSHGHAFPAEEAKQMKFPKKNEMSFATWLFHPRETDVEYYDATDIDAWRKALRKQFLTVIEQHKDEPLAQPTIYMLKLILEDWL